MTIQNFLFSTILFALIFSCNDQRKFVDENNNMEGTHEGGDNNSEVTLVKCIHHETENIYKYDSLKNFQIPNKHIAIFEKIEIGSYYQVMSRTNLLSTVSDTFYLVDGDAELSFRTVDSLITLSEKTEPSSSLASMMQYRTWNMLNPNQSIRIAGINITDERLKAAIVNSIENFEQLDINLTFEWASFWTAKPPFDKNSLEDWRIREEIDIIIVVVPGKGGLAGFPENGLAYDWIEIGSEIASSYGVSVAEAVVTHEIGHCIGLRHTDYFDRSYSCGGQSINEGSAGVGAVHIPGTPKGIDANSIMLSCYSRHSSGEFTENDIVALEDMYPN